MVANKPNVINSGGLFFGLLLRESLGIMALSILTMSPFMDFISKKLRSDQA